MRRIKVRLPATITNFGVGLQSLGIAVGLYTHVEIYERNDQRLIVETEGEGAGQYALGLQHPVVLALIRFFQRLERAPLGIHIKVDNQIPLNSGLGAENAFMVAGVVGANNLMGNIFSRKEIIQLAAEITDEPYGAIASYLGGLTTCIREDKLFLYRTIPISSLRFIVAVPKIDDLRIPEQSATINRRDVMYNITRMPLLLEALREGDVTLLAQTWTDKLHAPHIISQIAEYAHVAEVAKTAGAKAVTTTGSGPAMIFLAESNHQEIVTVIESAFENLGTSANVWILPVDTQGIVISMLSG